MNYDNLPGLRIAMSDGVATVTLDHPPLNLMDGILLPSLRGFINRVRDEITPGTSALFIMSTDVVVDKIHDAFAGQEPPELIFTNLNTEQEAALREVFGED